METTPGQEIVPGVRTTGQVGTSIPEQALILETAEGSVVITGCAHPGVIQMVKRAQEFGPSPLHLVMGGFHLLRTGTNAVETIAREFRDKNINYVSPTHCSGDGTISIFRETFGEHYIRCGTGKVINTADL